MDQKMPRGPRHGAHTGKADMPMPMGSKDPHGPMMMPHGATMDPEEMGEPAGANDEPETPKGSGR